MGTKPNYIIAYINLAFSFALKLMIDQQEGAEIEFTVRGLRNLCFG